MPLHTKCIHLPDSAADGIRISVLNRLTVASANVARLHVSQYHDWRKVLAPSSELTAKHEQRLIPWEEYEREYLAYLRRPDVSPHVIDLGRQALLQTTTILGSEEKPERCHRRLLALECLRLIPNLPILIR